MKKAKALPKNTAEEKEIRSDAIKNIRIKKRSASLIRKHGIENIKAPDESVKLEIMNREAHSFFESIKIKRELNKWLKEASDYADIIKPYTSAENLLAQAEYYTHYEELEKRYFELTSVSEAQ